VVGRTGTDFGEQTHGTPSKLWFLNQRAAISGVHPFVTLELVFAGGTVSAAVSTLLRVPLDGIVST
jgi:hypothetical protein